MSRDREYSSRDREYDEYDPFFPGDARPHPWFDDEDPRDTGGAPGKQKSRIRRICGMMVVMMVPDLVGGSLEFYTRPVLVVQMLGIEAWRNKVLIGLALAVVYYFESKTDETSLSSPAPAPQQVDIETGVGASWTEEEALIVKAKLWQMYSWTDMQSDKILYEVHGPGYENGPYEEIVSATGRFAPTAIRLGFHGCFKERDGTGGCDGCLYSNALDRIFMDYLQQQVIPIRGLPDDGVPNFNNGLKPVVDVLEEIYTNKSFPDNSPSLPESLSASGKSRGDLWAFAAIAAVEFTTLTNNMVCRNPDWDWPVAYPDGLDTNSFWGKHCNQREGKANCKINIENRIKFRTGRRDCTQSQLYQLMGSSSCPRHLDILTEEECVAAGKEEGVPVQFSSATSGGASCIVKDSSAVGDGMSLCYISMSELYNTEPGYYVVNPLHVNIYLKNCREDLQINDREDCKKASRYLLLPFVEQSKAQVPLEYSGCFVFTEYIWGGKIRTVVEYNEGLPSPPPDTELRHRLRFICHMPYQRAKGYMAEAPGMNPGNEMNGEQTVTYFREQFGLNGKESVAIMGAHTVGRFHARSSLFRYIWVRNGAQMFNNEYYENMALVPGYRFTDPDCVKVGDAYSQPPAGHWRAESRGEQTNVGPIFWVLYRNMCKTDCRALSDADKANNECCQAVPVNGTCNPSCVEWNSEGGNHESMLPSEMGLRYKFFVNSSNLTPYGCTGTANFNNPSCNWFSGESCDAFEPVGCPLNDAPAGDNMKMHEVVELYAHNQDLWIKDFHEAFEKVMQNGYDASKMTEGPDASTDVFCPFQSNIDEQLRRWVCFSTRQLSIPFVITSEKDGYNLQLNDITGAFEVGPVSAPTSGTATIAQNQKWYFAQTASGQQLVNGIMEFGVGNLYYNETSGYVQNEKGFLSRGYTGNSVTYYPHFDDTPWKQNLYKWKLHDAEDLL